MNDVSDRIAGDGLIESGAGCVAQHGQLPCGQTVLNSARLILTLILVGFLAGSMAACTSSRTSESTGEYVDDSVISNKVRGQLLGDKDLNITQIDIETYKGVVQLSGFVDTPEAKNRAGTVAASVSGVKQVRNNLIVK